MTLQERAYTSPIDDTPGARLYLADLVYAIVNTGRFSTAIGMTAPLVVR